MEMDEKKKSSDKKKKATAAAVSAAMLAGGVAASDMHSNAMTDDKAYLDALNPKPVVQMIDDPADIQSTDDKAKAVKKTQQNEVRQTVSKVLLLPLYAIGAVLMKAGELVLTGVLAPAAMIIFKWLLLAGIVLGVLAICLKVAFPDIPLGKMLTKKGILSVFISTAVFSAACEVIPLIWPDAGIWVFLLRAAGGLAIVLAIFATAMKAFSRHKNSENRKQPVENSL